MIFKEITQELITMLKMVLEQLITFLNSAFITAGTAPANYNCRKYEV